MKIEYKSEYERCGCQFSGDLAIVEYWEESTDHSRKLPLEGFGRGTCLDYLGKAKELLLSTHPNAEILLGIPVLVAKIGRYDRFASQLAEALGDAMTSETTNAELIPGVFAAPETPPSKES